MNKRILAVSARRDHQYAWMRAFLDKNCDAVAKHCEASKETLLTTGDTICWRLLDVGLFGVTCQEIWKDPKLYAGQLSDEQHELLDMLPTRVRP